MMLFRCDKCGKVEEAADGQKPFYWWQRTKDDVEYHACSRECRDELPGTPAPF